MLLCAATREIATATHRQSSRGRAYARGGRRPARASSLVVVISTGRPVSGLPRAPLVAAPAHVHCKYDSTESIAPRVRPTVSHRCERRARGPRSLVGPRARRGADTSRLRHLLCPSGEAFCARVMLLLLSTSSVCGPSRSAHQRPCSRCADPADPSPPPWSVDWPVRTLQIRRGAHARYSRVYTIRPASSDCVPSRSAVRTTLARGPSWEATMVHSTTLRAGSGSGSGCVDCAACSCVLLFLIPSAP